MIQQKTQIIYNYITKTQSKFLIKNLICGGIKNIVTVKVQFFFP